MSTTVVLRPDTTGAQTGWTNVGGPSNLHTTWSDNSDSTYATATNGNFFGIVTLGDLVGMPNGAQIRSVNMRVRASGPGTSSYAAAISMVAFTKPGGERRSYQFSAGTKPTSTATRSFSPISVNPFGIPWSLSDVNRLEAWISCSDSSVRIYEVYIDVVYNEAPTVTSVGPTGNVGQTLNGIWTYADNDLDPQGAWRYKVFTQAVATGAGFNPDTSAAVADSGTAYVSAPTATQWPIPPLAPGVYYPYVKVSDAGSGGRYSAWATSGTFTVVGAPPAPPNMISAASDGTKNVITVEDNQNILSQQNATAEGVSGEFLRWFNIANLNTPTDNAGTGFGGGDSVRATCTAAAATSVRTDRGMKVRASRSYAFGGWIKSSAAVGSARARIDWYNISDVFISSSTGNTITLSTSYQASAGTATSPATADHAQLVWESVANPGAGNVWDWDSNEVRLTALGGYRGGLDTRNLYGPQDGTWNSTTPTSNWIADTSGGKTGSLTYAVDGQAYDGNSQQFAPGTVGGSHLLKLNANPRLPILGARYQLIFMARGNAANLTVQPSVIWTDDNGAQVGQPLYGAAVTLANSANFGIFSITGNAPVQATKWRVEFVLAGEASTVNRFIFDRHSMARVSPGVVATQDWKVSPGVDTYPLVEYSDDAGVTWLAVRYTELSVYDPLTRQAVVNDWEAPPNAARLYRVKTAGVDYQIDANNGAYIVSAPSATSLPATLTVSHFYIVDIVTQIRLQIKVRPGQEYVTNAPQGVFDLAGRTSSVVLKDVRKGKNLALTFYLATLAELNAWEDILEADNVLYYQTPMGRAWYFTIGSQVTTHLMESPADIMINGGCYQVQMSTIEVARPLP